MVWFVLVLLVASLFYIGRRMITPSRLSRGWKTVAWIGLVIWYMMLLASVFLGRTYEGWNGGAPSWIGYTSMGLLSTLFFLLLLRDIVWLTARAASWARSRPASRGSATDTDVARRAHLLQLTNIGVVGAAVAVTSYGIFEARRKPGIVSITVPIRRLPQQFVGFRIVQITDLHAGLTIGREWIERVAEEVKLLKPDLIAFTGDAADGSVAHLRDAVAPLGELQAPHGKFFVTGNHEYYSGVEEWVAEIRRLGYDVLLNEHRLVERDGARIVLGGVTDFTGGNHLPSHRSDPEAAFRGAPPELARIFMAHQPKTIRLAASVDYDLMLSGHTHGGQFFPWNLATAMDQPYLSGLHRPDGKWIYVSKGTGYWGPPVRLGARSEITVITLAAEA